MAILEEPHEANELPRIPRQGTETHQGPCGLPSAGLLPDPLDRYREVVAWAVHHELTNKAALILR